MRILTLAAVMLTALLAVLVDSRRVLSQEPYDPYTTADAPPPSPDDGELVLIDERGEQQTFDADDLVDLKRQKVEVRDKQAVKNYEGYSLVDVLEHFDVDFGDALRGGRASTIALCEARDGYRIAISLLELDPATGDRQVILADRCEGAKLDGHEGPYRLVLPGDKRQIRSIRMLKTIRILNLKNMPLSEVFSEVRAGD